MRHLCVFLFIFLSFDCVFSQEIKNKSITLQEAIEIGIKNHPEMKAAKANISASKGRYWSGISLPQPEITYDNEFISPTKGLGNERTLSISQSFEFPSVYFLKGNKFNKEEEKAYFQAFLIEKSIASRIKSCYYKILVKQNQLKSAEEYLSIAEDFLKKSEIRLNVGEGTNLEKLTAKVQLSEARNYVEIAKNELKTAFAEFNNSIGIETNDHSFRLQDTLIFVDFSVDINKYYKVLLDNSPQLKIAELNCEIASLEKSLAKSSYLPNLDLAYLSQTLDNQSGFHGLTVGISIPFWFMFEQSGRVQEADANRLIFESEYQLAKNDISLKLENALIDFENSISQVKFYTDDILPQSEEIFRIASKSYEVGELAYLEYLQAKQTLISSKNNYNNALFNYYQSIFKIEEIVGQNIINK